VNITNYISPKKQTNISNHFLDGSNCITLICILFEDFKKGAICD